MSRELNAILHPDGDHTMCFVSFKGQTFGVLIPKGATKDDLEKLKQIWLKADDEKRIDILISFNACLVRLQQLPAEAQ